MPSGMTVRKVLLYCGERAKELKESLYFDNQIPFLIRVLEAGEIPYRKVGRHRRVLMKDILAYKQSMQVKRRAALDELVKASEDVGGYDL